MKRAAILFGPLRQSSVLKIIQIFNVITLPYCGREAITLRAQVLQAMQMESANAQHLSD